MTTTDSLVVDEIAVHGLAVVRHSPRRFEVQDLMAWRVVSCHGSRATAVMAMWRFAGEIRRRAGGRARRVTGDVPAGP